MALGYALSTVTLFQTLLKIFIGGLRSHFLTVCQPSAFRTGAGYKHIWFAPDDVCMDDAKQVREAQMSFPSGHSAAAFAGFGFLALYLNAKLKILPSHDTIPRDSDHQAVIYSHSYSDFNARDEEKENSKDSAQAPQWKLLLFVFPWLIAAILAASKVIDYWHHWSDVVAGSLLGILAAHMAYRMMYRGFTIKESITFGENIDLGKV